MTRKRRNYFVKSLSDAKVIHLSRNAFRTAKELYKLDVERLTHRLLQKVPVIRDWPLIKIVDISDRFTRKSYEPGEIIYNLGNTVDKVFFI